MQNGAKMFGKVSNSHNLVNCSYFWSGVREGCVVQEACGTTPPFENILFMLDSEKAK